MGTRPHVGIERAGKIADRHRPVGAFDPHIAVAGLDVFFRRFQQMAGDAHDLFPHRLRRQRARAAAKHGTAARIGAGAVGHRRGIAEDDVDIVHFHAELFRHDLRQGGFHPLPLAGEAEAGGHRAGRIDGDVAGLGAGIDRHAGRDRDARSDACQLRIGGNADPDPAALRPRRFLFAAQIVIADSVPCLAQAGLERGFVPHQPGRRLVGKFVILHQVAVADLRRVHADLSRRHV